MDQHSVNFAASNPALVEALFQKRDAEDSLLDFIRQGWNSLEPNTEFVDGWAVGAICEHLQAVTSGQITRLLINVPPGCMKSLTTNVFWPSWEWGPRRLPHLRYISASHEKELSIRDNVRGRDLMTSEWYQANWGGAWQFKGDVNAKIKYENTETGWRLASSTGAGLTGNRGDRILLDDPHAVKDLESEAIREDALRWFSETLPTRLNNKQSAIIVIMQRIHMRDVSGLILQSDLDYEHLCLPMEFEPKHRCWTTVPRAGVAPRRLTRFMGEHSVLPEWMDEERLAEASVPQGDSVRPEVPEEYEPKWEERWTPDPRTFEGELLWSERFDEEQVEQLKSAFRAWGGTYAEAGQLQQRPAPRGGGMFQLDDFQYLDALWDDPITWVRGWDLAGSKRKKSAWSVGVKMGLSKGRIVVADVRRFKEKPGEVERIVQATVTSDGHGVVQSFPQDPGQAGLAQKTTYLKLLHGFAIHFSPETGAKEDRATPLAAQAEGGNLYLLRARWNDPFVNELCLFPNGDFLDQADAASRAYAKLIRARIGLIGAGPRAIRLVA